MRTPVLMSDYDQLWAAREAESCALAIAVRAALDRNLDIHDPDVLSRLERYEKADRAIKQYFRRERQGWGT